MPAAPPEGEPLPLAGCYVLREARHADRRGHFEELFNAASWPRAGGGDDGGGVPLLPGGAPRQVSWSRSAPHTLRGMHTSPYVKLVTVVAGSCDDVLCDIRPQSPSFGRSVRLRLDDVSEHPADHGLAGGRNRARCCTRHSLMQLPPT